MLDVGVDVGGTFTDVVVSNDDGSLTTLKRLSTPDDYSRGILDGLSYLREASRIEPSDIASFIHAFTVATNALLTGEGARVGLITTAGFRDVLEIGRLRMPRLYDMDWDKPRPLVPRRLRFEVRERITARGEVAQHLDEDDAVSVILGLIERGADSVAVCLLHAYANPVHEQKILELVRRVAPNVSISASHQVLPEIREFERTSTTVVNAFVKPIVDDYLGTLERRLRDSGVKAPVMVMQSSGGIMQSRIAREYPAHCIESGPAAGAIGAAALGKRIGLANVIAFDMGGTTAKACLIEDGEPRLASEMEVGSGISVGQRLLKGGGYLVRVPSIDLAEIGAGGGSLAWVDKGGALKVGPQSAGAAPGPACYGLGGTSPTVTDANVVLGFLNSEHLLDGEMPIDGDRAQAAIDRQIATLLDLAPHEAAYGIHSVANATMVRAIRAVSSEQGRSPGEFGLIAFGGSGPVHAATLALQARMSRIIVPPAPGVFSAFGLLFTDVEHRFVQTYWVDADKADIDEINARFNRMRCEAEEVLGSEGFGSDQMELTFLLDLRYAGQSAELSLPVGRLPVTAGAVAGAVKAFHEEHERTYGYGSPSEAVQIINLRARARSIGRTKASPAFTAIRPLTSSAEVGKPRPDRKAYFGSDLGWVTAPVVRRAEIPECGAAGPLIVEEYDSTTVVPPRATVARDAIGNIAIDLAELL